jgi:diguanylate cyclase (GGDEF)-like protein
MTRNEDILKHFEKYEHFCKSMLDAYVVLNEQGNILKCNALFSVFAGGIPTKKILKLDSITQVVKFLIDGKELSIADFFSRRSPTRFDEVRGVTDLNDGMNLILGLYPFLEHEKTADEKSIGIFLLIRDVTAETNLQDKYKVKSTQSVTDKPTGMFNRGHFDAVLPDLVAQYSNPERRRTSDEKSESQHLSIIMGDIDHFKKVNDTMGHVTGDAVIRGFAEGMLHNVRGEDIGARWGGEEFVFVFVNATPEEIKKRLPPLGMVVEGADFDKEDPSYKKLVAFTVSGGITEFRKGESIEDAVARADAALYYSKKNGRDRITTSEEMTTAMREPESAKEAA